MLDEFRESQLLVGIDFLLLVILLVILVQVGLHGVLLNFRIDKVKLSVDGRVNLEIVWDQIIVLNFKFLAELFGAGVGFVILVVFLESFDKSLKVLLVKLETMETLLLGFLLLFLGLLELGFPKLLLLLDFLG